MFLLPDRILNRFMEFLFKLVTELDRNHLKYIGLE